MAKPNRNDPCPCGSGRKYKHCCLPAERDAPAKAPPADVMAGLRLHQAGRLDEAGAVYRDVLRQDPENPDALHMLGLIAYQTGEPGNAVELIDRAVRRKPNDPFALNNLGVAHLAAKQADEAVRCFRRALALKPEYPEALLNLGNAMKEAGRGDEAADCYRKAVAIDPANSAAHNNLGNVYRDGGGLDAAIDCYHRAIAANPRNAEAHNNLGVALARQGRLAEASESYRSALAIRAGYAEAHLNLGNALKELGRAEDAMASYREAISIDPAASDAHLNLGNLLKDVGRTDEAIACYREAVRLEPKNAAAAHLLAALTGVAAERAPSEYVAGVFDQYADRFDTHLVECLDYRVPEQLVGLLVKHAKPAAKNLSVLDLGCGTGLAGQAVAPYARELVGIDLSANMLAKAGERHLYQRLVQDDLVTAMNSERDAGYDVVMAADVFVYLGRLEEVAAQAARLLKPGGLFAFSVEALEALPEGQRGGGSGFVLNAKGRFSHSAAYVERLAAENGLRLLELTGTQTRLDGGVPVQGWLALMVR